MITRFKYKDRNLTIQVIQDVFGRDFKTAFKQFISDKRFTDEDVIWVDTNWAVFSESREKLLNPVIP